MNALSLCLTKKRIKNNGTVPQYYVEGNHEADIFCLPSLYEGYPNVICEAMACGLPVVCSNVCDNPLIVENGVGGFLFNPISEENIANALELMINLSKKDKLNMSRHNRRCVVERNSSVVFLNKYLTLIEKIVI